MAKKGVVFQLTAEERDPYSFEFTVERHKLLMSRTMKSEDLPVSGFCPVDFLMAGIAGCVGMTIRDRLEARGIAFSGLRLEAEGTRTEDWEKNSLDRKSVV